jgi:acetolactate synthase-1/2/3 large subunit
MTGGQIVARTLRELGADLIFSVSGNQILPIYDAAMDFDLRIIHLRHESAAAYAAAASAELSDRPGVALVTAGPGFLAATPGVAMAKSMEAPLLFLSGASATADAGAGGFQDFDQAGVARVACKATMQVTSVVELHTTLNAAWRLAQAGIPGPVHVSLPSDVLSAVSAESLGGQPPPSAAELAPVDEATLKAMAERLMQARRPLLIARQSAGRGAAGKALDTLARRLGIRPIITESPRGLGDLKYREIISSAAESDCALAIAPADFAVGFLAESVIARGGSLLHIDAPGDPPPRRVAELRSQLPPGIALPVLAAATVGHEPRLAEWARLWSFSQPDCSLTDATPPESSPQGLHPLDVARQVRGLLEPDDIIVLDGGEFCQWIRLGLRDLPNRTYWNGKLGGIGGSIPMALGIAATGHPGRAIVFTGDGSFGYHASEFETAARYSLPVVVIIGNDARWGAEWHLQVSRYGPHRAYETDLLPARYEQVASGLGAAGFHATDAASLHEALLASLSAKQPACLNVEILSAQSPAVAP